jgi:hypothetical protein
MFVSQAAINDAQQEGQAYWHNVSQDYNDMKLHKPFNIINNRNEESIKKRRSYTKHETHKYCDMIEHVLTHPESGTCIIAVVKARESSSMYMYGKILTICICRCLGPWSFSRTNGRRAYTRSIVGIG